MLDWWTVARAKALALAIKKSISDMFGKIEPIKKRKGIDWSFGTKRAIKDWTEDMQIELVFLRE